jgi:hypothetical protein
VPSLYELMASLSTAADSTQPAVLFDAPSLTKLPDAGLKLPSVPLLYSFAMALRAATVAVALVPGRARSPSTPVLIKMRSKLVPTPVHASISAFRNPSCKL